MNWSGAKLHLGCGGKHLAGWINADGTLAPGVDLVLDVAHDLDLIPAGVLTRVYTSHLVEHIHPDLLPGVLAHLYRALAPGGKLTVATISLEGIIRNAYENDYPMESVNSCLYGATKSTDDPFMAHRQCFTDESLTDLLSDAGFLSVGPWSLSQYPEIYELNDCARSNSHVTLALEGTK
jgi:predicted SAM-dependent methyltransferase